MSELRDEYYTFDMQTAIEEVSKCKQCLGRPCTRSCPLKVNVGKITDLINHFKIKEAYEVLISQNVLADYTYHLCKERPICTTICSSNYGINLFGLTKKTDPIDIPLLEEFLFRYIRDNGDQIILNREKSKKSVAIIGTNASSIACAFHLVFNGFNIAIYEKTTQLCPDLRTGISNVKIANEIVDRYEATLAELGAVIEKDKKIGIDFDIIRLRKEYDYLVLASYFENDSTLNISGETKCLTNPINDVLHLIMYATDFIKLPNREEYFKSEDKVIVIGNTNISYDVARIVHKFVDTIDLCFANDERNVSISNDELDKTKLKDINIVYNIKPVKINIVNNKVEITFIKTKNIKDGQTYNKLEEIFESEYVETCDHLIIDSSSGNSINSQITKLPGIAYDKNFNIITDEKNIATNDGSVYVCGELKNNDKSILESIKEGMDIAKSIIQESGGDIQEYKDEINDIIRKQSIIKYNDNKLGDDIND